MVPARAAAVTAGALLGALVLSGCSERSSWTGDGAAAPTTTSSTSATAPRSTSPAPSPSPTPTPTASPTPSESPTPTPTASATPTSTPSRPSSVLRFGDTGARVRVLQQRLSELGYWLGSPDGTFGALTQQAVFALQKSAGIARDGVVGPDTARALDRGVRPTTTLKGDGVDIDLARQVLMIVRSGKVATILNTSTGNGEPYTTTYGTPAIARTPTGSFAFSRKVDGMVENSLGQLWRPIFFTSTGYAVHGSTSIPPYPASHGCVRVSNAAMNMIWGTNLMPIGSTITVR